MGRLSLIPEIFQYAERTKNYLDIHRNLENFSVFRTSQRRRPKENQKKHVAKTKEIEPKAGLEPATLRCSYIRATRSTD